LGKVKRTALERAAGGNIGKRKLEIACGWIGLLDAANDLLDHQWRQI
jgi:hypothetical protein